MSAFPRQFSPASPVIAIAPQPSHQTPLAMAAFAHQHTSMPAQPSSSTIHRPPLAIGRKRSRDEASINLEPDAPAFGDGMVLSKPGMGYVAETIGQSSTRLQGKHAMQKEKRLSPHTDHLSSRSHKSQRMDLKNDHMQSRTASSTTMPGIAGASANNFGEPAIDDFTLHLGIGWRKISNEDYIQAAARGWARFIENHYPLSNVNILLESKGLQSYLVEASQGFFLFTEDLRQARLVSRNVEGALQNLQRSPPTFDGAETLLRAESPRPCEARPVEIPPTDTDMNLD